MLGLLKRGHAFKRIASISAHSLSNAASVFVKPESCIPQKKQNSEEKPKDEWPRLRARIRAEDEKFGIRPPTRDDTPTGMGQAF